MASHLNMSPWNTDDAFKFVVPLPLAAHGTAQTFYRSQLSPKKAKQVYLNTLAVYAVNTYLEYLDIKTDLESGDSWNPISQNLLDVADLAVVGRGRLECRSVLPDQTSCYVPPDVWNGRVGYVAVQFDHQLRYASLVGFLPTIDRLEVPLTQWRSLDRLLDCVATPGFVSAQVPIEQDAAVPTCLSEWVQGNVDQPWQKLDALFPFHQPLLQFRGAASHTSVVRGKYLNWDISRGQQDNLVLVVGVMPTQRPEMDIWVKLCPQDSSTYLPANLEVMVLDEQDIAVMQAQSRQTEVIQLKFGGHVGERFSVKVSLDESSMIETFVI